MQLSGIHLLLTYQCTFECDHCFVWGSPWQSGTMTIELINNILDQAKEVDSIRWIYFEGGEPFLYYPVLVYGIRSAAKMGFNVGIVTNAYWATSDNDARQWLEPLVGLIQDLSLSSDLYHYEEKISQQVRRAKDIAIQMGIPVGIISIAQPEEINALCAIGQLPEETSSVMYRGRAAERLVSRATLYPWEQFTKCPHENLSEPGRVHVDSYGNLHICQGISIGNLLRLPLKQICEHYDPLSHPIIRALIENGPVGLIKSFYLPHEDSYADACHLCYTARLNLRDRFPDLLLPHQMYGVKQ